MSLLITDGIKEVIIKEAFAGEKNGRTVLTMSLEFNENEIIKDAIGFYLDEPVLTFGGIRSTQYIKDSKADELIKKILDVICVDSWEDLVGQYIRVDIEFCEIKSIGHFYYNNWLNFKEFWNN